LATVALLRADQCRLGRIARHGRLKTTALAALPGPAAPFADSLAHEALGGGGGEAAGGQEPERRQAGRAGAVKVLGAGLVAESGSSSGSEGGGGGGALLGLAYGSDEEDKEGEGGPSVVAQAEVQQQDALQPQQQREGRPFAAQQAQQAQRSGDSGEDMEEASGDEAGARAPPPAARRPAAAPLPAAPAGFARGQSVLYLDRSGQRLAATVVGVDLSLHPPSYAVRIHALGTVRETDGHRLLEPPEGQQEAAAATADGEEAAPPAAPPEPRVGPQAPAPAPSRAPARAREPQQEAETAAKPGGEQGADGRGHGGRRGRGSSRDRSRDRQRARRRSRSHSRDRSSRSRSRSRSRDRNRHRREKRSRSRSRGRRHRGRDSRSRSRDRARCCPLLPTSSFISPALPLYAAPLLPCLPEADQLFFMQQPVPMPPAAGTAGAGAGASGGGARAAGAAGGVGPGAIGRKLQRGRPQVRRSEGGGLQPPPVPCSGATACRRPAALRAGVLLLRCLLTPRFPCRNALVIGHPPSTGPCTAAHFRHALLDAVRCNHSAV
jgi:hypothetical protein